MSLFKCIQHVLDEIDSCGETITKVFLSKNKLSEEEFYDKYEEFM